MSRRFFAVMVFVLSCAASAPALAQWGEFQAPAVPGADGFVLIPNAAVPIEKDRTYRAVYDATRAADNPEQLVPALNMAGSELNGIVASGLSLKNARFVVVFHGAAMDALLDDSHYRAKYGVANPNLKPISEMKAAGVEFFVCGQNLAFEKIDPRTLTPDVAVATDALIVLITYENNGYALLSF